ncbi:MAG: hypothetical protein EXR63_01440 [Dehalococcoidia bacterium]|nr:hypothetical protein [Dehalococcoidia bacterium]
MAWSRGGGPRPRPRLSPSRRPPLPRAAARCRPRRGTLPPRRRARTRCAPRARLRARSAALRRTRPSPAAARRPRHR